MIYWLKGRDIQEKSQSEEVMLKEIEIEEGIKRENTIDGSKE